MARPIRISFPAADTTAVAAAQTTAGAGVLTLAGGSLLDRSATMQNVFRANFGDGVSRTVSLTSTGNLSARTITVAGFLFGVAVTENLAGPNNNTVYTTGLFDVVTSVTTDGALGTAMSVGSGTTGATRWITCDNYISPNNFTVGVTVTATASVTVQNTLSDLNAGETAVVYNHPTLAAITASTESNFAYPPRFVRAILNSSSGAGAFILYLIQAGVAG